jgi:hypothetical protein
MRTATTVELSGPGSEIADVTVLVVEAQKLGLDVCWVAEAWGAEVRERWQRGDREGAATLVTDEMVLATTGPRRWSPRASRYGAMPG